MKSFVQRRYPILIGLCALATYAAWAPSAQTNDKAKAEPPGSAESLVARGRYLVKIAGCNDCHTAGYMMEFGRVPENEWLLGDTLGWKGPWGTTYASNLRIYMSALSEDDWVQVSRSLGTRPPMPWFALHEMKETDLRAIHRFVRTLHPVGEPAPAALPPGAEPTGPFVLFPDPPPAEK